jgi:hypothetical protein
MPCVFSSQRSTTFTEAVRARALGRTASIEEALPSEEVTSIAYAFAFGPLPFGCDLEDGNTRKVIGIVEGARGGGGSGVSRYAVVILNSEKVVEFVECDRGTEEIEIWDDGHLAGKIVVVKTRRLLGLRRSVSWDVWYEGRLFGHIERKGLVGPAGLVMAREQAPYELPLVLSRRGGLRDLVGILTSLLRMFLLTPWDGTNADYIVLESDVGGLIQDEVWFYLCVSLCFRVMVFRVGQVSAG